LGVAILWTPKFFQCYKLEKQVQEEEVEDEQEGEERKIQSNFWTADTKVSRQTHFK
jgi:hypothetical protein